MVRPDIETERMSKRDLSKTWLPITVVVSVVLFVGGMVWWVAGQSHDISDAKRIATEATALAVHEADINRQQADLIAAQRLDTAVIQTQLSAIRMQLDRIEAQQRGAR